MVETPAATVGVSDTDVPPPAVDVHVLQGMPIGNQILFIVVSVLGTVLAVWKSGHDAKNVRDAMVLQHQLSEASRDRRDSEARANRAQLASVASQEIRQDRGQQTGELKTALADVKTHIAEKTEQNINAANNFNAKLEALTRQNADQVRILAEQQNQIASLVSALHLRGQDLRVTPPLTGAREET